MNRKILLIGGGGHCKSVLDSLLELNEFAEIGIVDKKEYIGSIVMGIPVIGCDEDLLTLFNSGYKYAFVTVGSIGNPFLRIKLFNLLIEVGYEIPFIIDSSAKVSNDTQIEQGVFIGKQSIVNAGALIQKGAIINSGSIIEHDCQIGAFSHIAPGAVLGGGVFIGENAHIGSNATVKQQVHIGSNSVIGMGSVVLKDIQDSMLAYGNPCKEVRKF
ncbi:acetyltransferase [Fusibacter ferrireducens]|uniref:Acetyltransferase n=1 Tax=Fusibacter ferrireducens TaxID=2785058 RepID=A0ABR9ZXE5_9FIRM|nr:acetyltransferase [Fusibacter ferrireducens]MBF4695135.1 acetyltransferase [Fusibacter ferrireducens]